MIENITYILSSICTLMCTINVILLVTLYYRLARRVNEIEEYLCFDEEEKEAEGDQDGK